MQRSLVLFFLAFLAQIQAGDILVSEKALNIEGAFSNSYFKWIKDDICIIMAKVNKGYTNEIYRTTDAGQTWVSLQEKLVGSTSADTQPGFIYSNPADSSKIYIRGEGQTSWISDDYGATWEAITPKTSKGEYKKFLYLDFHPFQKNWALGTVGYLNQITPNDIYWTNDFGKTWNFVAKAFDYTWGDAGRGDVLNETIYLRVNDISGWKNFVKTEDFGITFQVLQSKTAVFLFREKQIFSILALPSTNEFILKVSPDVGENFKVFYEADFPFGNELEYNGYTILDDSTGAVYLGVNHNQNSFPWGNVYVSDSIGARYTLSISHVSQMAPLYDFTKVYGLDGVYITNLVDNWKDNPTRENIVRRSWITFDNGVTWSTLNRPHFDSNGQKIDCTGPCSLHIHGITSLFSFTSFGPVYSSESARGIILATGNVGNELLMEPDQVNTYMSRDGGMTWIELRKGNSIFDIGDHGSIIVLAPFGVPTTTIYYTLDEGTTKLKELKISSNPFTVENIRIEPTSTGEKFMVLGSRGEQGVVFGIDFSPVYAQTCVESDYEAWAPSNGKAYPGGLKCFMGRDITYRRRKASAQCFNSEIIDPVINITYCPCAEDDWECDLGYVKDSNDETKCNPVGSEPTYPPSVCPPNHTYNKTKGYRLVAGTYCTVKNGVNHYGDGPFPCPGSGNDFKYGWVVGLVVVLVVILILVVAVFAIRSEWILEKVPFIRKLHDWRIGYLKAPMRQGENLFETEAEEFSIGGVGDEENVLNSPEMVKLDEDSFNPRE